LGGAADKRYSVVQRQRQHQHRHPAVVLAIAKGGLAALRHLPLHISKERTHTTSMEKW